MNSCLHTGSTGQWTSGDITALDELYAPLPCTPDVDWWNGTTIDASFDGANCVVATPPAGSGPFVSNNSYYITPAPRTTAVSVQPRESLTDLDHMASAIGRVDKGSEM